MKRSFGLFLFLLLGMMPEAYAWGFFAHRRINWLAVMTLPPEMFSFYKRHIGLIAEWAVTPDERRYAVDGEAARHYIDLDVYKGKELPRSWEDAVACHTADTLQEYGIAPWNIVWFKSRLTQAFLEKDGERIIRLSAEIGHYLADAHVPLHTTENYNGQLTQQHGIHGFWESRLPELFANDYEYFFRPAQYVASPQNAAWEAIESSHAALDSVLLFEKALTEEWGSDKKYGFDTRLGTPVHTQSRAFSAAYHAQLSGQVERRMRASVQAVGDFWLTCWIDAGQPDLSSVLGYVPTPEKMAQETEEKKRWLEAPAKKRAHEH